jgi:hypothetical protein
MEYTSPNWRYRDKDGYIAVQYGETLISILRQTHGQEFARGIPGHFKLGEVLHALDDSCLNCLMVEDHRLTG